MSDKIDFSPLDPTADSKRFDARIAAIASLAAQRGVAPTFAMQVAALWRLAVVGSVGTALACWGLTLLRPGPMAGMPGQPRDALLGWAAHDDGDSRAMLLASLEVDDER